MYYEEIGQPEKAQQSYITSISNGVSLVPYYNLALIYFVHDQPESAEKIAKNGLHKFPYSGQLWELYALIENNLKHGDLALIAAKQAAIYYPNDQTSVMYNRLLNNLPVSVQIVPYSGKSKKINICLPNCQ